MPLPLLLALTLVQDPQPQEPTTPPTPPVAAPLSFSTAPVVAEPNRLRLTPTLDGKLDEEEWDAFSTSGEARTYLQWEPGKVFVAATGAAGHDLLVSLDLKGDGWLVGKDNLEVRVVMNGPKPEVTARVLDATNVAGPVWRDASAIASACRVVASPDLGTVELTIAGAGEGLLPENNGAAGARVDLVPSGETLPEPFTPRLLSPIQLVDERATALPQELKWNVDRNDKPVIPGDNAFIRFTFNGQPAMKLKKLDLRCEGPLRETMNQMMVPFPPFDNKGRAFIDYNSRVPGDTTLGYRILRGTLTGDDGVPSMIEASFRVAPPLDVDLVNQPLKTSSADRSVRVGIYLRSNANRPLSGELGIDVPSGYRILNRGETQKFGITEAGGRARLSFELFIPANAKGGVPVKMTTTVGGQRLEQTEYLTIE